MSDLQKEDVFLIRKSTINGTELLPDAYVDKFVAESICQEKTEEWIGYEVVRKKAEFLDEKRCVVGTSVFNLCKQTKKQRLIQTAIKKLTKDEIIALGLGDE